MKICSKCGLRETSVTDDCRYYTLLGSSTASYKHDWVEAYESLNMHNENVTLSLLVVDLGEHCLVKPDIGTCELLPSFYPHVIKLTVGYPQLFPCTFAEVKAAIDKLAAVTPPVPRIERNDSGNGNFPYRILDTNICGSFLTQQDYNALSYIIGKPLPIWMPSHGVWKRLFPFELVPTNTIQATSDWLISVEEQMPISVWRFQIVTGE